MSMPREMADRAVAVSASGAESGVALLGQTVIGWFNYVADLIALIVLAFRDLVVMRREGRVATSGVVARQILFTGVDALPVMSAIALMIGVIVITQAGTQLPKVGAGAQIGTIIVVTVIRELGPLLTMFIVVGRSGSAITTELGYMSVRREIAALELMGVSVSRFIVMPRMIGMILSMICLTLYFDMVAVLGGFILARIKMTVPFAAFGTAVAKSLEVTDLVVTATKGTLFGAAVAAICCHHGLSVKESMTEIPQQTTRAMINCLKICLVLDIIVTAIAYF